MQLRSPLALCVLQFEVRDVMSVSGAVNRLHEGVYITETVHIVPLYSLHSVNRNLQRLTVCLANT